MHAPVLVILNPASSGGRAGRLRTRIEAALSEREVEFDLRTTRAPGHATTLAREAVIRGCETVVAVGGDGTIHEIAQGLLDETCARVGGRPRPALAVVPVGTGNDFYRMVGVSRDPVEALEVLFGGRRARFDVGVARWDGGRSHFVNLFGVGVDVEVLRRRRAFSRLPGLGQYLAALLVAVVRFRPFPLLIRLEGEDGGESGIRGRTHLAAVTVGPSAGGGFLLNPGATPDDGELDLCLVRALSYLQIALYIPRIIRGTHAHLDVVELRRFERATIERPDGRPFHFQLDGELIEDPATRVELEVEPASLTVLVPHGPGTVDDGVSPAFGKGGKR